MSCSNHLHNVVVNQLVPDCSTAHAYAHNNSKALQTSCSPSARAAACEFDSMQETILFSHPVRIVNLVQFMIKQQSNGLVLICKPFRCPPSPDHHTSFHRLSNEQGLPHKGQCHDALNSVCSGSPAAPACWASPPQQRVVSKAAEPRSGVSTGQADTCTAARLGFQHTAQLLHRRLPRFPHGTCTADEQAGGSCNNTQHPAG